MENDVGTPDVTTRKPDVNNPQPPSRPAISFLIVTALLNTIGIGVLGPVLPFIVQPYLHSTNNLAVIVGWLTSAYAICQFIAAPGLGILSDRFGRRPLLLICLLGSATGYLLFGLGGALWVLFLGRIIDGLTGGNFSILFAYIGDISAPQERGKYFGMVGAASGVGFILGPAIGGIASHLGYAAPVYLAAALTVVNLVWGYFYLPESLRREHRVTQTRLMDLNPLKQLRDLFTIAQLRWLLVATFLFSFPFAVYTTISVVLVKDSLGWNADKIGLVFVVVGSLDILMQGVLIGRLLPIFGEAKLTIAGMVCDLIAYLLFGAIVFVPSPALLLSGIVAIGVGSGLLEPSLMGLLSRAVGPRQQGIVQGGGQAIQSLALIIGPLFGGAVYVQFGHASPYWVSAAAVGLAICAVLLALPALRGRQTQPDDLSQA